MKAMDFVGLERVSLVAIVMVVNGLICFIIDTINKTVFNFVIF